MNLNAVVISQLKKRREALVGQLAGIDAALVAFGGTVSGSGAAPAKAKKRKAPKPDPVTGLTPIQKAQAARKANIEARKAQGAPTQTRESRPRVPGTPSASKGASLAEAAS